MRELLKAAAIAIVSAAATYVVWYVVEETVRRARDAGTADDVELAVRAFMDRVRHTAWLERTAEADYPHVLWQAYEATREAAEQGGA